MPRLRLSWSGIEEAVDGRQTIAQAVGQDGADQSVLTIPNFEQAGLRPSFIDHGAVIAQAHPGHVAVAVARHLVGVEQAELLMRRDGGNLRDAEIGIGFQDTPHAAAGLEILYRNANRYAGGTTRTDRPVDNVVTPPEPRPRQGGVDLRRIGRGQTREQFTLDPAGQVGARHRA